MIEHLSRVFNYTGLSIKTDTPVDLNTRHELLDKAIIQMIGNISSDMMWFILEIILEITRSSNKKRKDDPRI